MPSLQHASTCCCHTLLSKIRIHASLATKILQIRGGDLHSMALLISSRTIHRRRIRECLNLLPLGFWKMMIIMTGVIGDWGFKTLKNFKIFIFWAFRAWQTSGTQLEHPWSSGLRGARSWQRSRASWMRSLTQEDLLSNTPTLPNCYIVDCD